MMPDMMAVYCPECGNEAMVPAHLRWPHRCPYCGAETKYLRLPGIVLRRRTKKAARIGKSKAAREK